MLEPAKIGEAAAIQPGHSRETFTWIAFVEEESKGFWWRSAQESRPEGSFHGKMPALLDAAAEGQFARDARGNTELPQPENYGENIFFNLTRSLTPEEREKVREALGAIGRETDES